jgi:MFS family permease
MSDRSSDLSTAADIVYARVTRRLLPFLLMCYVISYLDRVNVGFAKLRMTTDLGFSDAVYGFGAGIFFIGYFIFEVPSNMVLHRVGARSWIARIMLTWGLLSAATAWVVSPTQFYTVRFLLGVAEAGFFPGVLLYLTYWFPSARVGRATAIFMTAVPITGVLGSPMSGWILESLEGWHGLAGWQWLFILEAIPAILASTLTFRFLPNGIDEAAWLTREEKALLRSNITSDAKLKHTHTLRVAFGQPLLWLFAATYFCLVVGLYGVSFWLPTIIKSTGVVHPLEVGLLTAIPYGVGVLVMIPVSRRSDRLQERRWHVAASALAGGLGLLGSVLVAHNTVLSLIAMTIATAGIVTSLPLFWTLPYSRLGGIAAAAGLAMINSIGNLGGFVGPNLLGLLSSATHNTDSGVMLLAASLFTSAGLTMALPAPPRTTP